MKTLLPQKLRSTFHVELDDFGLYALIGTREFFWQFGLGMKNFALCTTKDREQIVIG